MEIEVAGIICVCAIHKRNVHQLSRWSGIRNVRKSTDSPFIQHFMWHQIVQFWYVTRATTLELRHIDCYIVT